MEWTAAGTCEKDTHKQTNGCLWVLGEYVYEKYAGICCDRRPCAVGWEVLAILSKGLNLCITNRDTSESYKRLARISDGNGISRNITLLFVPTAGGLRLRQ